MATIPTKQLGELTPNVFSGYGFIFKKKENSTKTYIKVSGSHQIRLVYTYPAISLYLHRTKTDYKTICSRYLCEDEEMLRYLLFGGRVGSILQGC